MPAAREPADQHLARFRACQRSARISPLVLRGASNYKQTGLLQAYGAYHLINGAPQRIGFALGAARRSVIASCSAS